MLFHVLKDFEAILSEKKRGAKKYGHLFMERRGEIGEGTYLYIKSLCKDI